MNSQQLIAAGCLLGAFAIYIPLMLWWKATHQTGETMQSPEDAGIELQNDIEEMAIFLETTGAQGETCGERMQSLAGMYWAEQLKGKRLRRVVEKLRQDYWEGAAIIASFAEIKQVAMDVTNDASGFKLDLKLKTELMTLFGHYMREILRQEDGSFFNLLEVTLVDPKAGRMTLTLQRISGKTPIDLLNESNAERDRLQLEVDMLKAGEATANKITDMVERRYIEKAKQADIQAEYDAMVETVNIVLAGLSWDGDGYVWDHPEIDYRVKPADARRMVEQLLADLRQQVKTSLDIAARRHDEIVKLQEEIAQLKRFDNATKETIQQEIKSRTEVEASNVRLRQRVTDLEEKLAALQPEL
jgi:hypothetical protein